jgi:hypothetical protein
MRTRIQKESNGLAARLMRAGALFILALTACGAMETQEQRPEGVPETPYWYTLGTQVFWYLPADSLAVVQMREHSSPDVVSDVLYELRDMGWRLTVERGPSLRRPGDDQSLDQRILQVERLKRAVSPQSDRRQFERRFWRVKGDQEPGPLLGILPGLLQDGEQPAQYFWPSSVGIVWGIKPTAQEAKAWLDSLGCHVITSSQLVNPYFIQRAWAIELPGGAELFKWIRRFNADERVRLALPLMAVREPPAVDHRILQRMPGPAETEPPEFAKLSPILKQSYVIAHFSGTTIHAASTTDIHVDGHRFCVRIETVQPSAAADSALVAQHKGEILSQSGKRLEAWIPYAEIPALAADTLVKRLEMVRKRP